MRTPVTYVLFVTVGNAVSIDRVMSLLSKISRLKHIFFHILSFLSQLF